MRALAVPKLYDRIANCFVIKAFVVEGTDKVNDMLRQLHGTKVIR